MWSNLNTALSDGHGSMSDIFAFVSKNMAAVEAAGDKDKGKGKASEPPKGDGKKPASQPKRSGPRRATSRVGQEIEEGEKVLAQEGAPRRHVLVLVLVLV